MALINYFNTFKSFSNLLNLQKAQLLINELFKKKAKKVQKALALKTKKQKQTFNKLPEVPFDYETKRIKKQKC
ncbi:hypothetical protein GGTG_12545 [Gaeumannomyces tritici R3-111a-1]|uniref:Uncharacterized protein n=1 Tax=Gaeumannomyces tritici (strain R3-111a-1) TaxID=644352 RepID=J3PGC0_GAET3|nr:hypothetical protein GGTG_12545 [Gaeumannomyces tritici R3-111a-1]EJT69661.1 hypothetical protein GGTG_12545 [Gaeumannomyces tritici R3-111a-1]